nr:immunoglobulin heavy chain junction region [Mus musculus]MBK4184946.1 immunoglobulin heavy chain junction region [Mus musculus]
CARVTTVVATGGYAMDYW